jgi:hypothetical protein
VDVDGGREGQEESIRWDGGGLSTLLLLLLLLQFLVEAFGLVDGLLFYLSSF